MSENLDIQPTCLYDITTAIDGLVEGEVPEGTLTVLYSSCHGLGLTRDKHTQRMMVECMMENCVATGIVLRRLKEGRELLQIEKVEGDDAHPIPVSECLKRQ